MKHYFPRSAKNGTFIGLTQQLFPSILLVYFILDAAKI
jgi:hypothetical protein